MKFFKVLGTIVVVLAILWIGISALLPAEFEVKRSTTIEAKPAKVYNEVLDLTKWKAWDPWQAMDPDVQNTYTGEAGVGQKNTWTSEIIGNGSQEVMVAEAPTRIESHLMFEGQGGGTGWFTFEPVEGGTKVTWGFSGENGFFTRIFGLLMDAFLGSQFEQGLGNMKAHIESLPDAPQPRLEEMEAVNYISLKASCTVDEIAEVLAALYGELSEFVAANDVEVTGMPMCFYHTWDGESTELEAAMPVPAGSYKLKGNLNYGTMEAGKVVSIMHVGPYETSETSHNAIDTFIQDNGLELRGAVLEIYVNDPAEVNPEEIKTKIIYPVAG